MVIKKKFKKVLVVLGGTSGERAVSLDSGKACIKALRKKKYIVSKFDPKFKTSPFAKTTSKERMLFLIEPYFITFMPPAFVAMVPPTWEDPIELMFNGKVKFFFY